MIRGIEMDTRQQNTYETFINNILSTRGRFACGDEYHESHHVIPRCMGGTDAKENLIDLFAKEHFIAHKLLAEENPDNDKLVYAWWMMAHIGRVEITEDEYEESKKTISKIMSERVISEETKSKISEKTKERFRDKENHPMLGVSPRDRMDEETYILWREHISNSINGENNPMYGRQHSDESKRKNSEAHKGRTHSDETKKKISETTKGEKNPNYGNHKLAGKNNPNYGKHLSEETRRKIGEANRNPSEETRKKMRDNHADVSGGKNPRAKIVMCIETHSLYLSGTLAAKEFGLHSTGITRCCCGKQKDAGGYNWKYIYDIVQKDGTVIPGALTLRLQR